MDNSLRKATNGISDFLELESAGGLLLMGGGLPLMNEAGLLIGSIGVSGGTPEQDAALARAATMA